jgi:hypothetical protein
MKNPTKSLRWLCAGALLLVASPLLVAQEPLQQQFGKWAVGSCPGWLGKLVAPATPVAKESSLKSAGSEHYCNGNTGVTARYYEFADPTGAYEFYTSELKVGMNATTIGGASAVDAERLLTLLGNYVIEISPPKNISDADLLLLLKPIKAKAMKTPLPPVRRYLPDEGMVQGTQRYALGPAGFTAALVALNENRFSPITQEIGFAGGAEAMLARYQVARNKSQGLLIIEYPTPQLAEQRLHHIQSVLTANPGLAETTFERKGSLLSAVLSPVSAQAAATLREGIRYDVQVTWNEPSQTLTDPPWLLVVKNIFIGTLAFCGVAVVMGVAFGGVRVITKRLFPGKVFDRPEDMEVLQLGLSGKRIDPRDFY